jgi:hypothetical protein
MPIFHRYRQNEALLSALACENRHHKKDLFTIVAFFENCGAADSEAKEQDFRLR